MARTDRLHKHTSSRIPNRLWHPCGRFEIMPLPHTHRNLLKPVLSLKANTPLIPRLPTWLKKHSSHTWFPPHFSLPHCIFIVFGFFCVHDKHSSIATRFCSVMIQSWTLSNRTHAHKGVDWTAHGRWLDWWWITRSTHNTPTPPPHWHCAQ